MPEKRITTLRRMSLAGILAALAIVLTRFFSIQFPMFRLGMGMMPVHLSGFLLGPVWGGLTGLTADLLGLLINPMGTPNLGITLTTCLHGVLAGLIMRAFGRKLTPAAVIVSGLFTGIICSWLLMSFFLDRMYGKGFVFLLFSRGAGVFAQVVVLMIAESLMIPIFSRIRAILPTEVKISWRRQAEQDKYDKISEKSFKTRR